MATKDLQDSLVSEDDLLVLPVPVLPSFPGSDQIREALKGIRARGSEITKTDFVSWVDFAVRNPDEIWDSTDSLDWERYFYVSYVEVAEKPPAFVVEVIQADECLEVNDFALILSERQLSELRSGVLVYSLRKEWERERLVRALNDKALKKYDEDRLAEAHELIELAIQLSAKAHPYLFNNKGLVSWKMGLTAQAKKDFEEAIELDSSNEDAYFNLGLIHFDEADYEAALKFLKRAVEISPSDSQFLTELGHLYLEMEREREALDLFERAIRTNPEDPQVDFHLGYYHLYKKNQPWHAVRHYHRGLTKDPDDQFALADFAVAHWALGNKRKALGIRTTLQEHPQLMPYTVSRLVYLNLAMGDYENALKYYRYAIATAEPFEPEWLHYYAALACAKTDRFDEASDLLELAIGLGGDPVIKRAMAEKALKGLVGTVDLQVRKKLPGKRRNR